MIIDFHTHTFPAFLADQAIHKLSQSGRIMNYIKGTDDSLIASMSEAQVDYSVLLPVATKPTQTENINNKAITINEFSKETGLISFGGIHPDNEYPKKIIKNLVQHGVKGIKLHPIFQKTYIDDIKYIRIIECACENNMIILIHAGYDITIPIYNYANISHIITMLDTLQPKKMILAHMGGWGCSSQVEASLLGRDVYFDTALSLLRLKPAPGTKRQPKEAQPLSKERFIRFVKKHGASKILFGTDCPWDSQKNVIQFIKNSGLTSQETSAILGDNAAALLGISYSPKKLSAR